MSNFDDIRPYNDAEVRPTLDRMLSDPELSHAVASLKYPRITRALPWLMIPLVKWVLTKQLSAVHCVRDLQQVVENYMKGMVAKTTSALTISGTEKLDPKKAYLFISNHRDIAMDPAFVNWAMFNSGFTSVRIAIGDNLLTKPYVSDLMRLNKSFIVNRSAKAPREKYKAAKHLSAYIHHSITEDNENIWIAQREGRAKDGLDATNSAVIGMLTLNKPKAMDLSEYVAQLNIVPVSISYEIDPCDEAKARELYELRTHGDYEKDEHEDVASIAAGIAGQKGHVHVAFGDVLQDHYENTDEIVAELDRQVIENYVLHPSNCFAYRRLYNEEPEVNYSHRQLPFNEQDLATQSWAFDARIAAMPEEHREIALAMYANPITNKQTIESSK